MPQYTVAPGDTLAAIAQRYGMSGLELYEHPNNSHLRQIRTGPERVLPGDEVWVPEVEEQPGLGHSTPGQPSSSPPSRRINPVLLHAGADLPRFKVRTGDTLENIAQRCGCTWEELARLNWMTTDPDEIDWYLGNYFVCKYKQSGHYVFSSEDQPGILLLPRVMGRKTPGGRLTIRATRFENT